MATELPAKVEPELAPAKVDAPVDVAPEKPVDSPTVPETKADDSKAVAVAESILLFSLFLFCWLITILQLG